MTIFTLPNFVILIILCCGLFLVYMTWSGNSSILTKFLCTVLSIVITVICVYGVYSYASTPAGLQAQANIQQRLPPVLQQYVQPAYMPQTSSPQSLSPSELASQQQALQLGQQVGQFHMPAPSPPQLLRQQPLPPQIPPQMLPPPSAPLPQMPQMPPAQLPQMPPAQLPQMPPLPAFQPALFPGQSSNPLAQSLPLPASLPLQTASNLLPPQLQKAQSLPLPGASPGALQPTVPLYIPPSGPLNPNTMG